MASPTIDGAGVVTIEGGSFSVYYQLMRQVAHGYVTIIGKLVGDQEEMESCASAKRGILTLETLDKAEVVFPHSTIESGMLPVVVIGDFHL
ncbi:hypothetical protein LA6_006205 (plasmid) [Marinibacterium anthonyi]|nr:hypothetical protein LA6_006205 [Marinibacterium anthonyi]